MIQHIKIQVFFLKYRGVSSTLSLKFKFTQSIANPVLLLPPVIQYASWWGKFQVFDCFYHLIHKSQYIILGKFQKI